MVSLLLTTPSATPRSVGTVFMRSTRPLLSVTVGARLAVCGTAAGLGWQLGFADGLFALAATLCFVVLYDASGVRRAAGLTAERVNGLVSDAGGLVAGEPPARPLKQNLGHTRLEVLVGSLMGPLVALPGLALVGSPLQLAQRWGLPPLT